jgi:DNA-directed RNA polymerase subunit M/transcription elongation factor TFIIS
MICDLCRNLLKIEKINNNIQYVCINCGNSYPLTNNYTLIYESSNIETILDKKGTDIYYLPCNPREFKQCPGCPEKIVAYERIPKVFTKVYGCKCGKMWYEKIEFDDKVTVKNVTGGNDNKDEKSSASTTNTQTTNTHTTSAPTTSTQTLDTPVKKQKSNKISIAELLKHSR